MQQHDLDNESTEMSKKDFQMRFAEANNLAIISGIERAKMALPIFGGTAPTTEQPESKTDTSTQSSTGGGDESKKQLSPEEISDLLTQITDANSKLGEANKKIEKFENDQKTAERAQLGKEEALTADLEEASKTILKMDAALKNQAVINAVNGFRDIEFHDLQFVLRELQLSAPEVFENIEVDLDNSTVTVKGVENHLRRIAKEKDWAVKKNSATPTNPTNQPPAPPSSGTPPANPSLNQDAATRRAALTKKFPVIGHGRPVK